MGGKEENPKEPNLPESDQPVPAEEIPATENATKISTDEQEILNALASVKGEGGQDKGMGATAEGEDITGGAGMPKEEVPLPTIESTHGMPPFNKEAFETPSPAAHSEPPVQTDALPPDPDMVKMLITDERVNQLWDRTEAARNALDTKVHAIDIARSLLNQIKYGQNYLMAGRGYYEEAERHVNEAEFRVLQTDLSRKWSQTVGIPLFIYEIVFAIGFIILFLGLTSPAFSGFSEDARGMVAAMICGGLGGVTGAWLALIKHVSQDQDFDKQHTLWYLNSPFMGAGIGAFIYWVMRAGMISLTNGQSQLISSPFVIYILAWLAGYQHNVFTTIVKRILKVFELGETTTQTKPAVQPPVEPSPPIPPASDGEKGTPSKG